MQVASPAQPLDWKGAKLGLRKPLPLAQQFLLTAAGRAARARRLFCALPVLEEEPLEPAEPGVPLEPDGLELPEAELPPLDDLLPS